MSAPTRASDPAESHPTAGLDDTVHQKARLGILAVVAEGGHADFPYLKDVLGLTDGNLGRHLDARRLRPRPRGEGVRGPPPPHAGDDHPRRTDALEAELRAMRDLLRRLDG